MIDTPPTIGTTAIAVRKNAMRKRTVADATAVLSISIWAISSRLRPPAGSGCSGFGIRK